MQYLSRLAWVMMFIAAGCAATRPIAPAPAEVQAKLRAGVKGLGRGDTVIVATRDGTVVGLKLTSVEPERLVGTVTRFYRRPGPESTEAIQAIPSEAGSIVAISTDQIVSLEQGTGRNVLLVLLLGLVVIFLFIGSQMGDVGPLGPPYGVGT